MSDRPQLTDKQMDELIMYTITVDGFSGELNTIDKEMTKRMWKSLGYGRLSAIEKLCNYCNMLEPNEPIEAIEKLKELVRDVWAEMSK